MNDLQNLLTQTLVDCRNRALKLEGQAREYLRINTDLERTLSTALSGTADTLRKAADRIAPRN